MNKITSFFLKKRKLTKRAVFVVALLVFIFAVITIWGNITLCVEHFEIDSDKISGDKGYKIAHVSDYHNTKNDFLNDAVISSLEREKPDIIVITGDLVDCRKTDINKGVSFATSLVDIAPVYYVTGNHECNVSIENQSAFDGMIDDLKASGVTVLRGECDEISVSDESVINLFGIDDPYFHCGSASAVSKATEELCSELDVDKDEFNILLSHHPEQMDTYSGNGFDLVFSGHAHGGQGRLFGVGLIAPDQGLFPEYSSGLYKKDGTTLVVSRGIGNSIIPVRVFDRPHLIYTVLKS